MDIRNYSITKKPVPTSKNIPFTLRSKNKVRSVRRVTHLM